MSQTLSELAESLKGIPDPYKDKPIGKGVKFRCRDGRFVVMYPDNFKLFLQFQELMNKKRIVKGGNNANY